MAATARISSAALAPRLAPRGCGQVSNVLHPRGGTVMPRSLSDEAPIACAPLPPLSSAAQIARDALRARLCTPLSRLSTPAFDVYAKLPFPLPARDVALKALHEQLRLDERLGDAPAGAVESVYTDGLDATSAFVAASSCAAEGCEEGGDGEPAPAGIQINVVLTRRQTCPLLHVDMVRSRGVW